MNILKERKRQGEFSVGDVVSPTTEVGLWLADVPVNGEHKQSRKNTCVFTGTGIVKDSARCFIDYDKWEMLNGEEVSGIGTIEYISYLIECDNGTGWAGMGAIVSANYHDEHS